MLVQYSEFPPLTVRIREIDRATECKAAIEPRILQLVQVILQENPPDPVKFIILYNVLQALKKPETLGINRYMYCNAFRNTDLIIAESAQIYLKKFTVLPSFPALEFANHEIFSELLLVMNSLPTLKSSAATFVICSIFENLKNRDFLATSDYIELIKHVLAYPHQSAVITSMLLKINKLPKEVTSMLIPMVEQLLNNTEDSIASVAIVILIFLIKKGYVTNSSIANRCIDRFSQTNDKEILFSLMGLMKVVNIAPKQFIIRIIDCLNNPDKDIVFQALSVIHTFIQCWNVDERRRIVNAILLNNNTLPYRSLILSMNIVLQLAESYPVGNAKFMKSITELLGRCELSFSLLFALLQMANQDKTPEEEQLLIKTISDSVPSLEDIVLNGSSDESEIAQLLLSSVN